ncbi:MAG: SGNH/GDSL hydrolase family protein [Promethearchaeota archaeon]
MSIYHPSMMTDEPVLLIKKNDVLIGNLIFRPTKILSVKVFNSSNGYEVKNNVKVEIIEDVGGKTRILVEPGELPFIKEDEIIKPIGSPNSYPSTLDGKHSLLFSESGLFHEKQVLISYEHEGAWVADVRSGKSTSLPRVKNLLKNGRGFDLFVFGDSISFGCNCSKSMGLQPLQEAYPGLLIKMLSDHHGFSPDLIKLFNASRAGATSEWGKKQLSRILKEHEEFEFDLNIIAWGANDAAQKRKPKRYIKNIEKQMKLILKRNPNAEFIIISSSLPNPNWIHANHDYIFRYESSIRNFCIEKTPQCEMADMTKLWAQLLKLKNYLDITGNGINHPNDFGHQLYALEIFKLLT